MKSEMCPSSPEERTTADQSPWAQVKAIFEQAVALHGRDRDLFIERHCANSLELKQEVQSLLENHQETDEFLEQPIVSIEALLESDSSFPGAPVKVSADEETQVGERIGAYLIEQEIGRGGMGEVYLATRADREFDKRVAIKLIRDGSQSGLAILRFRRERQILARLENAYIARLLDGGTTPQGLPYFVMEYVEGRPIHQYCDEQSLTIRERLNLFLKVGSAVQYAHERNIIHRDLKPGNILVKKDGTPKLLDFGIAKILQAENSAAEQDLTHHTCRILTPAYASPEQLRDGTATVKSDVYSLGVVLYELLCGKRPEDWYSHRQQTTAICSHEAHLSAPLRAIIRRAIDPDAGQRYETVAGFTADVRRYLSGAPPVADSPEAMGDASTKVSLAVVPFRILGDQGSANAFWAPGLTETLITKLSRIKRLSVAPPSSVLKYADGVEAVRAARELHVEYILEGSLYIFQENVRATAQLVFAEAGIAVWSGEVEATEKTLTKLGEAIAEQVAQAVLPHLTGEERAQISRSGTNNGAAYTAYLRGRWHWMNSTGDQERLLKALVCFREAIDLDPNFARAHAGIADYYLRIGLWGGLPPSESFAAAIESAQTAVRLEPTLAEAHASLGFAIWAYHRDEELAEKHFSLAIVRNPNYASAHHWFGLLNSARNRPELGIANLERAAKVDPNSVLIAAAVGFVHYNARQFDRALQLLLDAARELPKSGIVQEMLSWCYLRLGNIPAALECAQRAVQLGTRSSAALSALAHAEAAAQNHHGATCLRNEIEDRTRTMYVSSYDRASAALAVGQTQQALSHLEQARIDRDWWLCWIEVDPRWDPLRGEQRFKKLLPQRGISRRNRFAPLYLAVASVVLVIAFFAAWRLGKRPPNAFADVKFTKLTTNGTAENATISPNGKIVVYSKKEPRGTALWRHDVQSGRTVKLAEGLGGKLMDLGFTARGAAVQYVNFPQKGPGNRTLTILPVAGGASRTLGQTFPGPVSLSPDASQAAFYYSDMIRGSDQLRRLDLKTGQQTTLVSYKYPLRFAWNSRPAWSSDGRQLAYASEERDKLGFVVRLHVLDVATGARHEVSSPRWQWVESLAWKSDKSGFVVVGQRHESSFQQIWYIPYPASRGVQRIGNDLDDYIGASLTASGSEIVSVQFQTLSNIYLVPAGNPSQTIQVTPGNGRYFDLAWAPDGKILYASDATGSADLWMMNSDGSGQRQITSNAGRNYAPVASPDSRSLVFHSNRTGNWQVWRTNIDGTEAKQLSNSAGDGNWPQFTMGGGAVLFHKTNLNGVFNLWQVSADGGDAQQITTGLTMHPAVSASTGEIAAWYSEKQENPNWKIGIFGRNGGNPLRVLNPPPNARPDTAIRWMPKGNAIAVLNYANAASNLYAVPLDGTTPYALTNFESGEIFSFDWSHDGQLLYSRGLSTSDVVLIRDLNSAKGSHE
jgi:eukaryotic-like serine/threonine-protein kinase